MATSPVLISIEEYLHTSYKPDVHFVDGELEERNLGERTHGFLQGFFYQAFAVDFSSWRVDALIEQRIRINSSRVRICDVAMVPDDRAWEEVLETPPRICVEILFRKTASPAQNSYWPTILRWVCRTSGSSIPFVVLSTLLALMDCNATNRKNSQSLEPRLR